MNKLKFDEKKLKFDQRSESACLIAMIKYIFDGTVQIHGNKYK